MIQFTTECSFHNVKRHVFQGPFAKEKDQCSLRFLSPAKGTAKQHTLACPAAHLHWTTGRLTHSQLGCDNAKPKCENCHAHQRSCTYAVRIQKDRPSNSQINHLKEDNAKLQQTISKLRHELDLARTGFQDQNGVHATETALLDAVDSPEAWTSLARKTDTRPDVDETQKLRLLAEAARQRKFDHSSPSQHPPRS